MFIPNIFQHRKSQSQRSQNISLYEEYAVICHFNGFWSPTSDLCKWTHSNWTKWTLQVTTWFIICKHLNICILTILLLPCSIGTKSNSSIPQRCHQGNQKGHIKTCSQHCRKIPNSKYSLRPFKSLFLVSISWTNFIRDRHWNRTSEYWYVIAMYICRYSKGVYFQ